MTCHIFESTVFVLRLAVALAVLAPAATLSAQINTAAVVGSVTDPSGAVVPRIGAGSSGSISIGREVQF